MLVYAKAIVAALTVTLTAIGVALDGGITGQEWITALVGGLAATGAVWAVPNKPAPLDTPYLPVGA